MLHFFTKKQKATDLVAFIRNRMRTSKRSSAYRSRYRNVARKLEAFALEQGLQTVMSDELTETMCENFVCFLKTQKLRINTVRGACILTHAALRWVQQAGYVVNLAIAELIPREEEVTTIYLSPGEIERLYRLDRISRSATEIRDLFVVGCWTGLRYSDLSRLDVANIRNNVIQCKTRKTGALVELPQHRFVREILERYNNQLPHPRTSQNYNVMVKRLCRRAGIVEPVLVEATVGHKVVRKTYPKWQLVSSHTARRSFATNLYAAGVPIYRVMLCTGHKTEQAFLRYIRITRSQNAHELAGLPFFE